MNVRKMKGEQIAKTMQIKREGLDKWLVPSQSGNGTYVVNRIGEDFKCSCPDFQNRCSLGQVCKHIYAVEIKVLKWFDSKGNSGTEITIKKTYTQEWSSYNKSQITEKERFMELLKGLVENVPENHREGRGRPQMPVRELLFASALKVYSQFSLRRFMTDLSIAKDKGYVMNAPCYSLIGKFMEREDATLMLANLIQNSTLALRSVETDFAVDSSGFRTTKFNDYCREKHGTKQSHEWLKCHIITGVKTNVITGVEVGFGHQTADSPQFIPLVKDTAELGFSMEEVSADKAYNSIDNYNAVQEIGGQAYLPFKKNATGGNRHTKGSRARLWRKMFHYFQLNQDEFMEHYHKRSNVETTFFMVKAKFGDMIRSRTKTAQVNELLLKVLCHNIVVLNSAVNELGIQANVISS